MTARVSVEQVLIAAERYADLWRVLIADLVRYGAGSPEHVAAEQARQAAYAELRRLAEQLDGQPPLSGGGYDREPDPGQHGVGPPRVHHTPEEIGLAGLPLPDGSGS